MIDRLTDYTQRISAFSDQKLSFENKQKHLPLVRLLLFVAFALLFYRFLNIRTLWSAVPVSVAFAAFLAFSLYDISLKGKIKKVEIFLQINHLEVGVLKGDYSSFDAGNECIDEAHDYTHDLDIFGEGSLFQYLNRTATIFGKLRLADYLRHAFDYSDKVLPRQEAVKELAAMVELRQQLRWIFYKEQIEPTDESEISQWLGGESPIKNISILRILAYGLPAITLICIALSAFGVIQFPVFLIVLQLMIVFFYGKQTIKVQQIITSKSKILNKYAQCLQMIETTAFTTAYLKGLQSQLTGSDGQNPSKSIHQLSVLLKYMDSNLNLLVSVLLNGLFMFNLHLLLKVEKWKSQNKENVHLWFEAIADFDALNSLANFAFNHPEYIFPNVLNHDFGFTADNLGHPLIPVDQRVTNFIEIKGWNQFAIITGANMSGKSTFLRTIGVNYVLAMAGAPVCATKLSFYPIQIQSSIRTSDSLTRNESYFYAELKRLKQIIDGLRSGRRTLILLDEILKGTNSKDKQAGSIALIEQLLHYKSVGLFATHDLMLGELASRYPGQVNNLCFEISIEGDKMLIDYKLHPGVCKNLNATYLMKNMGILLEKNEIG